MSATEKPAVEKAAVMKAAKKKAAKKATVRGQNSSRGVQLQYIILTMLYLYNDIESVQSPL